MAAPSGSESGSSLRVPPETIVTPIAGHLVFIGNWCLGALEEPVQSWMFVPKCILDRVPAARVCSFEVVTVRHSMGLGIETGDNDQSLTYLVGSINVDINRRQEHLPSGLSVCMHM